MADRFIPALADLRQDIAGPIPVEIIQKWMESDQSDTAHDKILEEYKRVGTMVSSDSAGLSKLSAKRTLMEVMKLVSEPKEIIHAHGRAIGGTAVGVWAADNTQMFYDDSIDVSDVVGQMVSAQRKINNTCEVRVGIGIHTGRAFEIGGGLYGAEADEIEEFTEEETSGEEIAMSKAVSDRLKAPFSDRLKERDGMFSLDYTGLNLDLQPSDEIFYPAPFHREFHKELLDVDINDTKSMETLRQKYVRDTTIVLLRIFHVPTKRLLEDFTNRVGANTIVHQTLRNYSAEIVKSNGALAILECDDPKESIDLAIAFRQAMKENGYTANVGVSKGEALIFELDGGGKDLAGSPINIASKLAEDTDEREVVFLHDTVSEHAKQHGLTERFSIEKSGVTIEGVKIK